MSPILGIFASSMLGAVGDYESIATTTVGAGGTSFVEFTSIPSTYKHLQVRIMGSVNNNSSPAMYLNGDTTNTNYRTHVLLGNGTAASSNAFNDNFIPYYPGTGTSKGVVIIDILDYADTNKNTTSRVLGGYDANGTGFIFLQSLGWFNTAAVSSIRFKASALAVWEQNTSIALYGVK